MATESDLARWADPSLLVLTSLAAGDKHGYAITRDIADSMGVDVTAGTLYGVIARLEERGYIESLPSSDRRRPYRITATGAQALAEQSQRMRQVAGLAIRRVRMISTAGGAS
jgi:DNA-binding PadR family transcriptional regulator